MAIQSAQELINETRMDIKKFKKRTVLERGVPLAVLKAMTTKQIRRLEKEMKGG